MGRVFLGLVLVVGMLWLGAPADAFTITNGEASTWLMSFGGVEGYATRRVEGFTGDPQRLYVEPQIIVDDPLVGLPGYRDIDLCADPRRGKPLPCNLLLPGELADLSWRTLRNLVALPLPSPYTSDRPLVINRWIGGGTTGRLDPRLGIPMYGLDRLDGRGIITIIDPDPDVVWLRTLPGSEAFALYPKFPQGSSFSGSLTGQVELFSGYRDLDYGGAVVTVIPTPEPATAALLLAAFLAFSARRRLR